MSGVYEACTHPQESIFYDAKDETTVCGLCKLTLVRAAPTRQALEAQLREVEAEREHLGKYADELFLKLTNYRAALAEDQVDAAMDGNRLCVRDYNGVILPGAQPGRKWLIAYLADRRRAAEGG